MPENPTHSVVAVKLRYNPKIFWFDPAKGSYQTGQHVLVDTERGREIGLVVNAALEVDEAQINALNSPLKPVVRALTDLDYDHIDALDVKGKEALPVFREMIGKHQLDMKPVAVEYLFSGDKAVFYFSSDERVDFRELVRELASYFHTRVDMRQIGVRDEARMLGGLAHCGEELCCARLGGEFQPVSIRMAKEQDLPLNPAKISGACGRLMCCLRYEFEAYKDFKGRAPKKGAIIETPLGQAKVIDFDTPREVIQMRLEDGKHLAIPLRDFDCPAGGEDCKRPCRIGHEAIESCASSGIQLALAALEREGQAIETPEPQVQAETRRPRRRSSNKSSETSQQPQPSTQRQAQQPKQQQPQSQAKPKTRQRPGQRSSALRGDRTEASNTNSRTNTAAQTASTQAGTDTPGSEGAPRRRRRRRSSGFDKTEAS
jgi:cell fate regulator YaaT (PSP1 superfamily)